MKIFLVILTVLNSLAWAERVGSLQTSIAVSPLPESEAKQFVLFAGGRGGKLYGAFRTGYRQDYNYQAIIEVDFQGRMSSGLLRDVELNYNGNTFYFETLDAKMEDLQAGQIWKGNICTNGGKEPGCYSRNAALTLKSVLYFKKLDSTPAKPTNVQYILLGAPRDSYYMDYFIVHDMLGAPDFMQIWQIYIQYPYSTVKPNPYKRLTIRNQTTYIPWEVPTTSRIQYIGVVDGTRDEYTFSTSKHIYYEAMQ